MPAKINPIRQEKLKQGLLKGKSTRQAMLDAGYAQSTADHRIDSNNGLLKVVRQEILNELKAENITVNTVITGLLSELEKEDIKGSDRVRIWELLGKWQQIFKDNDTKQGVSIALFANDLPKRVDATVDKSVNNDVTT